MQVSLFIIIHVSMFYIQNMDVKKMNFFFPFELTTPGALLSRRLRL